MRGPFGADHFRLLPPLSRLNHLVGALASPEPIAPVAGFKAETLVDLERNSSALEDASSTEHMGGQPLCDGATSCGPASDPSADAPLTAAAGPWACIAPGCAARFPLVGGYLLGWTGPGWGQMCTQLFCLNILMLLAPLGDLHLGMLCWLPLNGWSQGFVL